MKKILTSNGKILTENGKILTANVESGGGLIEVTELPEVGEEDVVYKLVSGGTQVPNSGYVDMVYYNYNLTIEETNNILSQLTYIQTPLHQKPISGLLLTENEMGIIAVDWGDGYEFLYLPNLTGTAWVTLFNSSATTNTSLDGWNSFEETEEAYRLLGTFEANVLSNYNGIPIGTENDKITSLFSTTPFEAKEEYYIYEDSEPTQVPNSGMVDKIYFNTDLSIEEVVSILKNAQVNGGTNAIINYNGNDLTFIKVTNNSIPTWYIGNFSTLDIYFASNTTGGYADFEGWKSNFNGVLEINGEVTQGDVDNSKLVDLVSITPFGSGWIKISGNEIDLTKYPSYPYTFGSVYKYADDTATIFIKQNKDNVEMIQKTSSYFVYSKIYANVKFTNLSGTDLVKYTNDDRRLFISEFNTFFGMTIGTLEESFYQLIFNLDGSKMKMLVPSGDTPTTYELSLQADTTEWDALISENNIPEITEDTEA